MKISSGKQHRSNSGTGDGGTTRLIATLVLIPTVPMLLLSIAALAVFYIAPTRFGNLIARLPGETFIRTALVFAPATLFAVVVLAALYAMEKPKGEVVQAGAQPGASQAWGPVSTRFGFPNAQLAARLVLVPAVPALLFSTAIWALSFVAPGRFDRMIEPLPGDRYLRPVVNVAPILFFVVVLAGAFFAFYGTARLRKTGGASRLKRLAVGAVLVSAIPTLLLSLAALGLFLFFPARFESLISRLPFDEFVRLALVFAPAVLLGVALLAVLYLRKPRAADEPPIRISRPIWRGADNLQSLRSLVGLWVLVGGLTLTAVVALGLLGAVLYLVLR